MRFENISNDLKCILFEKYGFLFLKSPIHIYQYETPRTLWKCNPIPESHIGMYSEPMPIVSDTPVDSAILYLYRIRSLSSSSLVILSSFSNCVTGLFTRPRVLRLI
jgi:hypothetical protein